MTCYDERCARAAEFRVWFQGCESWPDCDGHPACATHAHASHVTRTTPLDRARR
jgi:hypothetical protein